MIREYHIKNGITHR